jgi:hypothetical protein
MAKCIRQYLLLQVVLLTLLSILLFYSIASKSILPSIVLTLTAALLATNIVGAIITVTTIERLVLNLLNSNGGHMPVCQLLERFQANFASRKAINFQQLLRAVLESLERQGKIKCDGRRVHTLR